MKEIKIGEYIYKIAPLKRRQMSKIEDESMNIIPGEGGKLKWGTWKDMHCAEGIAEWNIKDEKGNVLPITLENVREYMSNEHVERLWAEISALSTAGEAEKKG